MTVLKVRGAFWTGSTGRQMRALPNHKDVRILASYLITGPSAIPYGLYFLSREMARIETHLTDAELDAAFLELANLDFAHYDPATGWVWVVEMAAQQLGAPLKPTDYNVANANRWYRALPNNPYLAAFWARYETDLGLGSGAHAAERREYVAKRGSGLKPLQSPIQAPPKGRSRSDQKISTLFVEDQDPAPARTNGTRDELLEWFGTAFWPAYPRKTAKKDALKAVQKLAPEPELRQRILAAVEEQKRTIWQQAELTAIPHAATWINAERWNDEVQDMRPKVSKKTAGIARAVQDFVGGHQQ